MNRPTVPSASKTGKGGPAKRPTMRMRRLPANLPGKVVKRKAQWFRLSLWPFVSLRVDENRLYAEPYRGKRKEITPRSIRAARIYYGSPPYLIVDTYDGFYAVCVWSKKFDAVYEHVKKITPVINGNAEFFREVISLWRVVLVMAAIVALGAGLGSHFLAKFPDATLLGAGLALPAGMGAGLGWHLAKPERRGKTRFGVLMLFGLIILAWAAVAFDLATVGL